MEEIANMTIGSFIGSTAGVIAVLALIIEALPVKAKPLTVFLKTIGRIMNEDLNKKVDKLQSEEEELKEKMEEQGKKIDDNERDRIRFEILSFANSCSNGNHHSMDEFNHIFEIYDKYHEILDRLKESNGKIDNDMKYIRTVYLKCLENHSFRIPEDQ